MKDKYKKYINYIAKDIELPYLRSLESYGLKQDEMDLVLGIVFNQPVSIEGRSVYNTNGNIIYYEDSDGYWIKYEYDDGNQVYREDADGCWVKQEYDTNGNKIYFENSTGIIRDNR